KASQRSVDFNRGVGDGRNLGTRIDDSVHGVFADGHLAVWSRFGEVSCFNSGYSLSPVRHVTTVRLRAPTHRVLLRHFIVVQIGLTKVLGVTQFGTLLALVLSKLSTVGGNVAWFVAEIAIVASLLFTWLFL